MFGSHLFRSPPKMFHVDANSRIALFDICRCELGYFAHLDIARVFKAQIAAHRFVGFAQFAWPCRDYCFGMMDVGMRQDGLLKMDHPMKDRKSTRLKLQSLMRSSYAVFCLKKKTHTQSKQ